MLENVITFDKSARGFVLDAFDKAVDGEGYIVEKTDPAQRVRATDGELIKADELAGIKKGSLRFFKSDLGSLISLADSL